MGPTLVNIGWLMIVGSIGGFILRTVGPKSRLWWPDRPEGRCASPTALLVGIPLGIAVIIVGAILTH